MILCTQATKFVKGNVFLYENHNWNPYTAISIKVVHDYEQSGKIEYERERLLGIAMKFINLLAIPSSLSRSYSIFPLCSWTTLIEIAVC
jgi:hypothetical protein